MILIYYIIWAVGTFSLFYFGRKLFRRIRLKKTNIDPMYNDKELLIVLDVISKYYDDEEAFDVLIDMYDEVVKYIPNLDVLFLTFSRELCKARIRDNRAIRITKRLAHYLYRKYKLNNPNYSRNEFLQCVD
jgi:formylmethanofuran dehydrogenase subunit E-like metal-binding protein